MTAAELEFTFLSISSRYKPYKEILSSVFYRTLFMAGMPDPRKVVSEEERERCVRGYWTLQIRDEVKECLRILKEGRFRVWCLTTGDLARMPEGNVVSCDSLGVAKPDLEAYRRMREKLEKEEGDGQIWFAAAHMWDVSCGWRGCEEIYEEEMNVVADGLVEMAEKIVEASKA
ncbi:hypothetical protein BJX70DRAFT_393004 [Aspergillus crustosus]